MGLLQSPALPLGYSATRNAGTLGKPAARVQALFTRLSCIKQCWKQCAIKVGMGSEDWAMEQHDGFGGWVGGVAEVVDVAVGAQAANDSGSGWCVQPT